MTEATARMHARTRVRTSVLSTEFGTLVLKRQQTEETQTDTGQALGPSSRAGLRASWEQGHSCPQKPPPSSSAGCAGPGGGLKLLSGQFPSPRAFQEVECVGGSWVPGWGCPRPDHQEAAQPGDLAPGETAWKCTVGDDDRA